MMVKTKKVQKRASGKFYYEKGVLERIEEYNKGLESGIWKYYNDKGELIREEKK